MYGQEQIDYINGILNHPSVANNKRTQALRNNLNTIVQNSSNLDNIRTERVQRRYGQGFGLRIYLNNRIHTRVQYNRNINEYDNPYADRGAYEDYNRHTPYTAEVLFQQKLSNLRNQYAQQVTQGLNNLISSVEFIHLKNKYDNAIKVEKFQKDITNRNNRLTIQAFKQNIQDRKDTINRIHKISSLFRQRPQPQRLTVNSKPEALVNAVNKLQKSLQGKAMSTAPIARGHDDFFHNILMRNDNA